MASITGPPGTRLGPRSIASFVRSARPTAMAQSDSSSAIRTSTIPPPRSTHPPSSEPSARAMSSPRAPSIRCRPRWPPASCSAPDCRSPSPTSTAPTSCSCSAPTHSSRMARSGRPLTCRRACGRSRHAVAGSSSSIPFARGRLRRPMSMCAFARAPTPSSLPRWLARSSRMGSPGSALPRRTSRRDHSQSSSRRWPHSHRVQSLPSPAYRLRSSCGWHARWLHRQRPRSTGAWAPRPPVSSSMAGLPSPSAPLRHGS